MRRQRHWRGVERRLVPLNLIAVVDQRGLHVSDRAHIDRVDEPSALQRAIVRRSRMSSQRAPRP